MLKTNSKKARENIRAYIADHFDGSGYGIETPETFAELAAVILDTFAHEKPYSTKHMYRAMLSDEKVFIDWASGLPSILDTCYYYNRSAVTDLAVILEETPEEAARYSESQAEQLLTHLIYQELLRGRK